MPPLCFRSVPRAFQFGSCRGQKATINAVTRISVSRNDAVRACPHDALSSSPSEGSSRLVSSGQTSASASSSLSLSLLFLAIPRAVAGSIQAFVSEWPIADEARTWCGHRGNGENSHELQTSERGAHRLKRARARTDPSGGPGGRGAGARGSHRVVEARNLPAPVWVCGTKARFHSSETSMLDTGPIHGDRPSRSLPKAALDCYSPTTNVIRVCPRSFSLRRPRCFFSFFLSFRPETDACAQRRSTILTDIFPRLHSVWRNRCGLLKVR